MPFQSRVNQALPLAVAGDFASANPRAAAIAGEAGFVAGPAGVTVGKFAWAIPGSSVLDTNATIVTNFGQGGVKPVGFIGREQAKALITTYLAEFSSLIPQGFAVVPFTAGDFFAVANGAAATVGAAIYASYTDGSIWIGAAPTGATATGSDGATFTATASGANLTTSAVTGLISIGDTISGTGVPVGTTILSQTSGTIGGAGVYVTSVVTTATAATVTSFGIVLNVTAVGSGTLAPGQAISGTGIPAGASIESQVSGAIGGIGVYTINIPATAYAASTAVTVSGGILTSFLAQSVANVGELVKIHNWGN